MRDWGFPNAWELAYGVMAGYLKELDYASA
jgi:hypothetical protein